MRAIAKNTERTACYPLVALALAAATSVGCSTLGSRTGVQRASQNVAPPSAQLPMPAQLPQQVPGEYPQYQASAADAAHSAVVPASFQQRARGGQRACQTCQVPTIGGDETCSCGVDTGCAPSPAPRRDAQEYIFDGGDQQPVVIVKEDWTEAGLDPTDTVAYYETDGGQVCVKPTNRVPIYAPRFGTVRQVRGLHSSELAIGTERILAPLSPIPLEESLVVTNLAQPLAPHGEAQVNQLDALQENNGGVPLEKVVGWRIMADAEVPHEMIDWFKLEVLRDEEIVVIGRILQGALEWYQPESLGVMIKGESVAQTRDEKFAKEVYLYEAEDKCSLRICKAASHTIADSGDTIRFTIRFDNIGPRPVRKAVILDNLSPRLEYIAGSQQCTLDAGFEETPNKVGSSKLKWAIDEIPSMTGGVISFDCKVR